MLLLLAIGQLRQSDILVGNFMLGSERCIVGKQRGMAPVTHMIIESKSSNRICNSVLRMKHKRTVS